MKAKEYDALDRQHDVVERSLFGQAQLRRLHHVDPTLGLCAALVRLWWSEVRAGRDGIDALKRLGPSDMDALIRRQAASVYFDQDPVTERTNQADRDLLRLKYGTSDLAAIRALCTERNARSFLELDLSLQHDVRIIDRLLCEPSDLASVIASQRHHGVLIVLMRYAASRTSGREERHRLGIAIDANSCRFYDPNIGQWKFATPRQCGAWARDFFVATGYETLCKKIAGPSLRAFWGVDVSTADAVPPITRRGVLGSPRSPG